MTIHIQDTAPPLRSRLGLSVVYNNVAHPVICEDWQLFTRGNTCL